MIRGGHSNGIRAAQRQHTRHVRMVDRAALTSRRLRQLLEVSKLLTRFESVERTVPAVVAIVAEAMPLCSVTIVGHVRGNEATMFWGATGLAAERVRAATAHAQASYFYLSGGRAPAESGPMRDALAVYPLDCSVPASAAPLPDARRRFVALPLVVGHLPVFGVLQLEASGSLCESDLVVANIVANQLAVALDRQATIDAQRSAAEASRRAAEQQLAFTRAVTGSLTEGVLAVDLEERITFFNPGAERMLRMVESAAIGRSVWDVARIHEADGRVVPPDAGPLRSAMDAGLAVRGDERLLSCPGAAAFSMSFTAAPIRREGVITGAVLTFEDTTSARAAARTERVLAAVGAALASSLEYEQSLVALARALVPALADVCFIDVRDYEGRVSRLEPIVADPAKQAYASEAQRFAPGDGWDTPQERALRTGESILIGEIDDATWKALAHDAEEAELLRAFALTSLLVVPLVARGRTLGVLTLGSTRTDRRYTAADRVLAEEIARRAAGAVDVAHAYRAARRAAQTREDVVAIVSHDLKSPLSAILIAAQMVRRTASSELARAQVDLIRSSAERMQRLIHDLLDFASLQSGRLPMAPREYDVRDLVEEAVGLHRGLAAARSQTLEATIEPGAGRVVCDRERAQQVFSNLIGNSLKFTPIGGAVTVRAEIRDGQIWFSVADTGPGIPAADLAHLFERYWQAHATVRGGSGLGLSIAKGIVEAHGGQIVAESTEGIGTTVRFTLAAPPSR